MSWRPSSLRCVEEAYGDITTTDGATDVNQVRIITVTATSGGYRLSFNGNWTAPIAHLRNSPPIAG